MESRTSKVIEQQEIKTIATQEDALKALSEMITAGFTTHSKGKRIKRIELDDNGNSIEIVETTDSIKPNDMTRAIELMAKLQGWGSNTNNDELNAVDKLLNEIMKGTSDESNS